MKRLRLPDPIAKRRAHVLAGIIILQALCALFFLADVAADLIEDGTIEDLHMAIEAIAAFALICGVLLSMIELRQLTVQINDMDAGLRVARGQMAEVMEGFYQTWNLTQAERDIATMILKGLDNDAIADVRKTAAGTVRAQTTSVYAKSGTSGRAQFVSLFVEELMSGDFVPKDTAADGSDPGAQSLTP